MVAAILFGEEAFDLMPGTSINLKTDGMFFGAGIMAQWSLPFKLPFSEKNQRLMGNYHLSGTIRPYHYLPVRYRMHNGDTLDCRLKFETDNGFFSCTLFTEDVALY